MGSSYFGQISGSLNNGGKFYTQTAITEMEIEMPGGEVGVTEAALASSQANLSTANETAGSGSAVITELIADAAAMTAMAAPLSSSIHDFSVKYLGGI